jgi:predicted DNA-binding ribbon-helix-helix protein
MQAKLGATMKSAIVKRSIVLNGHKTSVSLENEFWEGLREIGDLEKTKLSTLLQKIDLDRRNANLSSAIRIFVLNHFRALATGEQVPAHDVHDPALLPAVSSFAR